MKAVFSRGGADFLLFFSPFFRPGCFPGPAFCFRCFCSVHAPVAGRSASEPDTRPEKHKKRSREAVHALPGCSEKADQAAGASAGR